MNVSGHFAVHRKIFVSDVWRNSPPELLKIWLWILGQAAWTDGDHHRVGVFTTTMKELRDVVSYRRGFVEEAPSIRTIQRYIKGLEDAESIVVRNVAGDGKGKLEITVCNYEQYQINGKDECRNERRDGCRFEQNVPIIKKEEKKDKGGRSRPRTPLPDSFLNAVETRKMPSKLYEYALKKGLDHNSAVQEFTSYCNHALSVDRRLVDWFAGFRNWVDKGIRDAQKKRVQKLTEYDDPTARAARKEQLEGNIQICLEKGDYAGADYWRKEIENEKKRGLI